VSRPDSGPAGPAGPAGHGGTAGHGDLVARVVAHDGKVAVRQVPAPELRRGEVLVATQVSAISPGTETTIIRATASPGWMSHEYPATGQTWPPVRAGGVRQDLLVPREPATEFASLGYSLAGRVLAVADDVTDLAPGDRVACGGSQCAFHAERVAVPRSLAVHVPDELDTDLAAFVTLGSIALEALRRSGRTLGETIMVFGCGVLGALITMLARAAGIYVIAVDLDPDRLRVAAAAGAMLTADGRDPGLAARARECTDGFGVDAALVTVTTQDSGVVNAALDVLRPGGALVGVGQFGMSLDRDRWFGAQATVVPSVAYGPGRYDPVYEENNWDYPIGLVRWTENRNMAAFLRLAADGRIDLRQIPVIRVPLASAGRAYPAISAGGLPLTGLIEFDAPTREAGKDA
jgi:threonine dehydrogenase-like Zn-dependent dehydrogenase